MGALPLVGAWPHPPSRSPIGRLLLPAWSRRAAGPLSALPIGAGGGPGVEAARRLAGGRGGGPAHYREGRGPGGRGPAAAGAGDGAARTALRGRGRRDRRYGAGGAGAAPGTKRPHRDRGRDRGWAPQRWGGEAPGEPGPGGPAAAGSRRGPAPGWRTGGGGGSKPAPAVPSSLRARPAAAPLPPPDPAGPAWLRVGLPEVSPSPLSRFF